MNLTPGSYAEICKQFAFISALIAGFSFAFISVLLTIDSKKRIIDWVIGFAIATIAGFLICAVTWTLSASRMAIYTDSHITELPLLFLKMHRVLSFIFMSSFFLFVVDLGLSGWIRSMKLGIVSGVIALISGGFFIWLMSIFMN
jgi:hypothetical protein